MHLTTSDFFSIFKDLYVKLGLSVSVKSALNFLKMGNSSSKRDRLLIILVNFLILLTIIIAFN